MDPIKATGRVLFVVGLLIFIKAQFQIGDVSTGWEAVGSILAVTGAVAGWE